MVFNKNSQMIRLDSEFTEKAIGRLLQEEIEEGMITYTLEDQLNARSLLNFVISYRYIFSESGKIIPIMPLGELFYGKSTVVEPRNIESRYTLMFERPHDRDNFIKWGQRLEQRARLLPGPETNTEVVPVYPTPYELECKMDPYSDVTVYVLKEHHLKDIGWLERRCSERWYFQNNMLFFLDREPLMEWKLRKRDD